MAFQVLRIAAVVALLCVAAVLATPPGRVPLPFRGLMKMFGAKTAPGSDRASLPRRLAAGVLVSAAVALCIFTGRG